MDRTHIYPALSAALAHRGFDPATIEKYGQLWDSTTRADRLPCPLCFTYAGKRVSDHVDLSGLYHVPESRYEVARSAADAPFSKFNLLWSR